MSEYILYETSAEWWEIYRRAPSLDTDKTIGFEKVQFGGEIVAKLFRTKEKAAEYVREHLDKSYTLELP